MFDIVGKRFRFFLISGVIILIGLISLATFGIRYSIEFSPGSMMTASFEQEVSQSELTRELNSLGYTNARPTRAAANIGNTGRWISLQPGMDIGDGR